MGITQGIMQGHVAYAPIDLRYPIAVTDVIDKQTGFYIYTGHIASTEEKEHLLNKLVTDYRYKALFPKKLRKIARKHIKSLDFWEFPEKAIQEAIEIAKSKRK